MKTLKKALSLILALLILSGVLAVSPLTAYATEATRTYGAFTYMLEEKSPDNIVLHITGYDHKNYKDTEIVIPDSIDGKPVRYIERDAFNFSGDESHPVKSIYIPDSIVSIYNGAFYKCPVESVRLPNKYEFSYFQENRFSDVFKDCNKIKEFIVDSDNLYYAVYDGILYSKGYITLAYYPPALPWKDFKYPSALRIIGNEAFADCQNFPKTYSVPNKVSEIKGLAFSGRHVEKVTLPSEVTKIQSGAFDECTSLKEINLEKVEELGTYAFFNCKSLESVNLKSMGEIGSSAFKGCDKITSYNLESVKKIGEAVFEGSNASTFTLKNIETIGARAFRNCKNITGINLRDVTSIGESAFEGCTGLKSLDLSGSNEKEIGKSAFSGCTGLESVNLLNVGSIGESAFKSCTKLTTLDLSGGTSKHIYSYAFENCSALQSVNLNIVSVIGQGAFKSCVKLQSVDISSGTLEKIDNEAFENCSKLTSVSLPASLKNLGVRVFKDTALKSITIADGNKYYTTRDDIVYKRNLDNNFDTLVMCPPKKFIASFTVMTLVDTIADYAFEDANILNVITQDGSTTTIGKYAFANSSLTGIKICDSITTIGTGAFLGTASLGGTTIGKSVKEIPDKAFMDSGLKTVTLNSIVTSIGDSAFENTKLTAIKLPGTLNSIGKRAFMKTNLSEVDLPKKLSYIGEGAFEGTKLTELTVPGTVLRIRSRIVFGCPIESVTLDYGVVLIEKDAFSGCSSIEVLKLPETIETIEDHILDTEKRCVIIGANAVAKIYALKNNYLFFTYPDWNEANKEYNFKAVNSELYLYGFKKDERVVTVPDSLYGNKIYYMDTKNLFNGLTKLEVLKVGGTYYKGRIPKDLFNSCKNIKSLVLLETVSTLDVGAASDLEQLEGVTFPSSLKGISKQAFSNCKSLKKLDFTDTLITIEENAFSGCNSLESLTLPENLSSIGKNAFANCESLKTVEFPPKLYLIDEYAFGGCSSLESVSVNNGAVIRRRAFADCDGLKTAEINTGSATFDVGDKVFENCTALESATISGIYFRTVPESTFRGCTALKEIKIDGAKEIGKLAFDGCTALDDPKIPNTLEKIGEEAFRNCTGIKTLKLRTRLNEISKHAFIGCTGLTRVTVPSSVKTIGSHALGFTLVSNAYTKIDGFAIDCVDGSAAFEYALEHGFPVVGDLIYKLLDDDTYEVSLYCGTKNELTIPDTFGGKKVSSIGETAFLASDTLQRVIIPEGVTKISRDAFRDCKKLKSVTIPASVTTIESGAFIGADSLTDVILSEDNPNYTFYNGAIYNKDKTELIIYADRLNRMNCFIPNTVKKIDPYALESFKNLLNASLPEGLEEIGEGAFYNCANLRSITVPASVTEIGDKALGFYNGSTGDTLTDGFTVYTESGTAGADYADYSGVTLVKTDVPETTVPATEPATASENQITFSYLPDSISNKASFRFVLTDKDGADHSSELSETPMELEGVAVRNAKMYYDYTIDQAAVKQEFDGEWYTVLKLTPEQLFAAKGKVVRYDGSIYGDGAATATDPSETAQPASEKPTEPATAKPTDGKTDPTEAVTDKPAEPSTDKPTEPVSEKPTEPATDKPDDPVVTDPQPITPEPTDPAVEPTDNKKDNPVKVTAKAKTVKLKKLKKKAQKVKPLTIKNAQGKVSIKITSAKKAIKKYLKFSLKGTLTIKKWKKAKKGTYKIKVKITAKGNSNYKSARITKTVVIKVI